MEYIQNLKPAQYKLLKHAASQIAGRKPRRTAPDFKIPRESQYRAHHSPYKESLLRILQARRKMI